MVSDKGPRPACVEDEDDTGKTVRGSRRSAVAPKEKPKVHRESRSGKSRRSGDSAPSAEQSANPVQDIEVVDKAVKLGRRGSTSSSIKSPRKSKPLLAHENRILPKITIPSGVSSRADSTYYGIPSSPAMRTPAVSQHNLALRPRAETYQSYPRPNSYYSATTPQGGAGPPLSSSAFYGQSPMMAPSYPPPNSGYMRYAATPQPQTQYTVAHQYTMAGGADYFATPPHAVSRPLAQRFQSALDPVPRTTSAFGSRDVPRAIHDTYDYYDDGYTSANEGTTIRRKDGRRSSMRGPPPASAFSRFEADSSAMPPPSRPQGILRRSTDYSLDPVGQDFEVRDSRTQYRDEPRPARRPSVNRNSVSYDLGRGPESVRIEPANTGRRRQSCYDPASSATGGSSAYEEKLNQAINEATNYQEDVGGPTVPLTAEVLKRQQRRQGGSSRSTKSSASRDESDYKKSQTTRTTRSGSGGDDENVTIKVTGQARVVVGGAQIDCTDAGTIEIKRNQRIRGGSDRSSSDYGDRHFEDRQSRVTRPTGRSRISSQSGQSYTRSPQYPMDNYI